MFCFSSTVGPKHHDHRHSFGYYTNVVKRLIRISVFLSVPEPNAFNYLIGYRLGPKHLARDYKTFKCVLSSLGMYANSGILGPSVSDFNRKHVQAYVKRYFFINSLQEIIKDMIVL